MVKFCVCRASDSRLGKSRWDSAKALRSQAVLAILCGLLVACTANRPRIVLNEDGLYTKSDSGSFAAFTARYDALRNAAKEGIVDSTKAPTAAQATALVKSGTAIAYELCSSFFRTAGTEQQYLLFSRDVVAIVGTLATGVLGATNAGAAATGWVGVGSGAALSGISIYSRNFLFSEDNVQAVQNLVLGAMSEATARALERNNYDFDTAVVAIMDVQSVCEVQHILSLVRQSINAAQPKATVSPDGARIRVDVPVQVVAGVPGTPAGSALRSFLAAVGQNAAERQGRQALVEQINTDLGLPPTSAFVIANENTAEGLARISLVWTEAKRRRGL